MHAFACSALLGVKLHLVSVHPATLSIQKHQIAGAEHQLSASNHKKLVSSKNTL
jgi:hypothetical protein